MPTYRVEIGKHARGRISHEIDLATNNRVYTVNSLIPLDLYKINVFVVSYGSIILKNNKEFLRRLQIMLSHSSGRRLLSYSVPRYNFLLA